MLRTQIQNTFWRDVLDSLTEFNKLLNLTPEDIIREPLWYPDFTKFRTTIVPQWERHGLRFIGDLFNKDSGNLLSREEIKLQYRISMSFLCYESLIRSLPQEVRNATLVSFERPNIPFRLQLFLNKHNIARYCYSPLINKLRKKCKNTEENIKKKWYRDIGLYETVSMVSVKKATLPVYLRYLHYRIINRIITTNKILYIINTSENNLCTFCKHDTEAIIHLFWQCPVTQNFLKDIDRELYTKYNIHFQHCKQSWFYKKKTKIHYRRFS